tara:strand:- start:593 stop:775 length:183 start_codon:yes stop_codon:yes gene_type:complete
MEITMPSRTKYNEMMRQASNLREKATKAKRQLQPELAASLYEKADKRQQAAIDYMNSKEN